MNTKSQVNVYIDGSNVFYTQKKLGWSIDWLKMKSFIEKQYTILQWKYYVGVKPKDESMLKYLGYLQVLGFKIITKPLKKIKLKGNDIHNQPFIYKATFDVEITTDALMDQSKINILILFSGDSDFAYLIEKLKIMGKTIIIFSSHTTLSWELKLAASKIIYFEKIHDSIKR